MFMGKIEAAAAADTREMLAQLIASRLNVAAEGMQAQWQVPGRIRSTYVDGLVPDSVAHALHAAFPAPADAMLDAAVEALRHPAVVEQLARITGLAGLEPDADSSVVAISAMGEGASLRPHLDSSHDREGRRYRVLNLTWSLTPGWDEPHGGNLQLWDQGPGGEPRTITSHFNRLVLVGCDRRSWHSVNAVRVAEPRCSLANAYFSPRSPAGRNYFHASAIRPERASGWRDLAMRADNALRTGMLRATGNGFFSDPHF